MTSAFLFTASYAVIRNKDELNWTYVQEQLIPRLARLRRLADPASCSEG